jgi:hypothetical protein
MIKLRPGYSLAGCCNPSEKDAIVGYYSHENLIKVHRADCGNLSKAEKPRLINLNWAEIMEKDKAMPRIERQILEPVDYLILQHHSAYGSDYSLAVAALLRKDKELIFKRHDYLREKGYLKRVGPVMIQYRKNIVKGKWIKHRIHTYYELTQKGKNALEQALRENQLRPRDLSE